MNKIRLTREEVNDMREVAVLAGDADIVTLVDAFLAQEEELKEKDRLLKSYGEMVHKSNEQWFKELQRITELEAENQVLKATIETIRMNIKDTPVGHEKFKLDCIKNLIGDLNHD